MNILHIGKYYPPYFGGMETYLRDLAEQQAQSKHQVTAIVHNHKHGILLSKTSIQKKNKVSLIRLKSTRPILFTPVMIGLNRMVKDINKKNNIDVVHISWPNPSAFMLLINKKAKQLPWVVQWQSDMVTQRSSVWLKMAYTLIKPFERKLLKQASGIIVNSEYYLHSSKSLKPFKHKTRVIPLGMNDTEISKTEIDKSDISVQWAKQQWHGNRLRVFSLGRLTFYKNHQFLIKACKAVDEIQLIITGKGQLENKLKQLVNQLKLHDKIQLTGALSRDKINALYNSCDVFCLASNDRAESYGLVLLEAMIHDKIILVADTAGSGMKWLAENYNKGFIFKSEDQLDWNKQIAYIQANLKKISQQPKDFSLHISKTAKAIDTLYRDICAQPLA